MNRKRFDIKKDAFLRICSFPLSLYKVTYEKDIIDSYKKNSKLQEAVFFSSKELFNSLQISSSDESNKDKFIMPLVKYILRATTRTSPFNLFGLISYGSLDDETSSLVDLSKLKVKLRPSFSWIRSLILEFEKKLGENLSIIKNNTLRKTNVVITNLWTDCFYSEDLKNDLTFIRFNELINGILKASIEFIRVSDLVEKVSDESRKYKRDVILKVIDALINKEFLISNLRINILSKNNFGNLISILDKEYNVDISHLNIIKNQIEEINSFDVLSITKLKKIEQLMNSVIFSEETMTMDLVYPNNIKLENSSDEIEDFITFLIMNHHKSKRFSEYKNSFLEKYGNGYVKYLDVIDTINGLGAPEDDLDNFYTYCYGETEVINVGNYLHSNIQQKKIDVSSFSCRNKDIYNFLDFQISFTTRIINGKKKWILSDEVSLGSNSIDGKYSAYFPNSRNDNDSIEVEIQFITKSSKACNILTGDENYSYLLTYGFRSSRNKVEMSMDDIYISLVDDRFVFFSKALKKEVIFKHSTLVQYLYMPNEIKYLLLLQRSNYNNPFSFLDIIKKYREESDYFPEVVYKEIVIFPEKISLKEKLTSKDFAIITNKLGRFVFAKYADQRLLLDLKNNNHISILNDELQKRKSLDLEKSYISDLEDLGTINSYPRLEKHFFEVIFSVTNSSKKSTNFVNFAPVFTEQFYPWIEWLYLKFYIHPNLQNYMIYILYEKELRILLENKIIENFHFVKYKDQFHHIRLRIKVLKRSELMERLSRIYSILNDFGIEKVTMDTFEPEYTRYGGKNIFPIVSKIFFVDSLIAINLLHKKNASNDLLLLVLNFLQIYECFYDFQSEIQSLKLKEKNKQWEKEYRLINNTIYELAIGKKELADIYETEIINLIIQRNIVLTELKNTKEFKSVNEIDKRELVLSLIHMSFNRLSGKMKKKEEKINYLSFKAMKTISYVKGREK